MLIVGISIVNVSKVIPRCASGMEGEYSLRTVGDPWRSSVNRKTPDLTLAFVLLVHGSVIVCQYLSPNPGLEGDFHWRCGQGATWAVPVYTVQ